MGYYSKFKVYVRHGDINLKNLSDKIREVSEYQLDICGNRLESEDTIKWYDCENDMKKISKNWPNVFFVVEVVGESDNDEWKLYVHNGRAERINAQITITYSDSKLLSEFEVNKAVEEEILRGDKQ